MNGTSFFTEKYRSLLLLKCNAIKARHAFSTRLGGVSTTPGYQSLDLGAENGEEAERLINENRDRFASYFGATGSELVFGKQIHSSRILYADGKGCTSQECDGFVTDIPGVIIAVKSADCIPILFCDEENEIIGAAHAGWRGTVSGVGSECVEQMVSLGASREKITAAIGAGIGKCCYQVDDSFLEAVSAARFAPEALKSIKPDTEEGRYRADLVSMNRDILISSGLQREKIHASGFCTCCRNDLFFSHRAGKGVRGLMMSAIML